MTSAGPVVAYKESSTKYNREVERYWARLLRRSVHGCPELSVDGGHICGNAPVQGKVLAGRIGD